MDEVGFTGDINETIPENRAAFNHPNKNIEIGPIELIRPRQSRSGNKEIPVVEVPGTMEPLISDFPAASEHREFQSDLFQQNIIDEDKPEMKRQLM